MTEELPKVYDPKAVEKEVYDRWIASGAFNAEPADSRRKYCIVIPPPNVTDRLHVGHALNNTLQDVLVRLRRMQQYNTLWMPGTDHAGIATQTVVEKRILAEEGRRRTDFSRDEFVARIQAWKDEYEATIIQQLKLMGCSCDWRRTRFTMDEVCAKAVRAAFFKLFADGLIYRGKRLVNWDPATQTVLADDEVEYETVKGHFWYMRYPVVEGTSGVSPEDFMNAARTGGTPVLPEYITVATTRPETMLGDTAVAMNAADPRAKYLVGKMVRLPIVGRIIPIIADEHVVLPDPESEDEKARFSTGFLKVTPAHDPDDYAIGQRHGLPVVNVMAPDGSISDKHGWDDATAPEAQNLIGMDRFKAREAVVEFFRAEGLLENVKEYTHEVGHSYRSHVPIEPYLSDQWYIAVKKPIVNCPCLPAGGRQELSIDNLKKQDLVETRDEVTYIKGTDVPANSLAGLALAPLLDGRVKFTPERYAATYKAWIENLRDWPISRQLWWGHRMPIWSFQLIPHLPHKGGQVPQDPLPAAEEVCKSFWQLFEDLAAKAGLAVEDEFHSRGFWNDHNAAYVAYIAPRTEKGDALLEALTRFIESHQVQTLQPGKPLGVKSLLQVPKFEVCTEIAYAIEKLSQAVGRDEDVLDTWFSSALWPFSTMGWPDQTPELKKYYPGDVLCTAREIITLWVTRMVMMGQYCVGDIPFSDVFIHAMIQDGEGRKMSKSLGNGIDPLDIIDSHGADAMRFTLVSMTTQTQDVRMPVEEMALPDGRQANTSPKFDIGRNFCNKLWNASRFALMNLEACPAWSDIHPTAHLADRWILSRLNGCIRDVTGAIEAFRFNEVADTLYHFMWDDFCDWYLEIAKGRINAGQNAPKAVLACCLDVLLRLLHPVMPFITEALWQKLGAVARLRGPGEEQAEPMLVAAQWPHADAGMISAAAEEEFATLQEVIRQIRNARAQHNVPPGKKLDVIVEAAGRLGESIADNTDLLKSQAQLGDVKVGGGPPAASAAAAAITVSGAKIHVLDIVDVRAEKARLEKQAATLRRGVDSLERKLNNEGFLTKAPPDLVARECDRMKALQRDLDAVSKSLEALG
jgi:valyl-tRNA synthetase